MNPQPLTDVEFDKLTEVLSRFGSKNAMNLEQTDGFLAALICGPVTVLPSEYLPVIWGDDIVLENTFKTQPVLQDFLSLIMRHWNAICDTLGTGKVYLPLLLEDEQGIARGNDWAIGFMRGMDLRPVQWVGLLNDEKHSGSMVPIFALAHEHDPNPDMRPYKEPVSEELRENLIIGIASGVMAIYRYFKERPVLATQFPNESQTFRRDMPKVGRNDPCPCGSGRKFKYCCGTLTLH
jgi:uncharacterized protein